MTTGRHESSVAAAVQAALDVLVFAPLGLGAKIVEDTPGLVAQARQELSNARFIGRMTVAQSVNRLREQIEAVPSEPVDDRTDTVVPDDVDVERPAEPDAEATSDAPRVDDLALPDYDQLPAIDIVAKLARLGVSERTAIGEYESANRQRRTVLGKLAQLSAT